MVVREPCFLPLECKLSGGTCVQISTRVNQFHPCIGPLDLEGSGIYVLFTAKRAGVLVHGCGWYTSCAVTTRPAARANMTETTSGNYSNNRDQQHGRSQAVGRAHYVCSYCTVTDPATLPLLVPLLAVLADDI
ncbi:unnamed protein product [Sphacelaria rigidula]